MDKIKYRVITQRRIGKTLSQYVVASSPRGATTIARRQLSTFADVRMFTVVSPNGNAVLFNVKNGRVSLDRNTEPLDAKY